MYSRESHLSLMNCAHPNLGKRLDTGIQTVEWCLSVRRDNIFLEKVCGEQAYWFEPKKVNKVHKAKNFLQRLFNIKEPD